jgi:DNA mismatch repair protein MutL
MNRIRLLSEQVANQIAAGEVVERPASVVKELVENSLDAGAHRITVEIQAGGRSLIRVVDDGIGMNRDDALLSLERHATSKIQKAEDLSAIATMGFRGEALPSIASVSRMSLTTRERDGSSEAAVQIVINGGKIIEVKAAGSPSGTTIEVRQLFFNLPARRKFLRSEETEYAHVHHYLTLAALAHPDVAFTFVKDGRMVWQLPAIPKSAEGDFTGVRERMRSIMGPELELLAVKHSAKLGEAEILPNGEEISPTAVSVWGFIGKPGVSRSTREDQHLFVNRRPVDNKGLNWALLEGYHTALMKGRYPVCCLFLEIDPAAVDVNIHPAKREVKFHDERGVRQVVAQGIRETLLNYHSGAGASTTKTAPVQPKLFKPTAPIEPTPTPSATAPFLPKFPTGLPERPAGRESSGEPVFPQPKPAAAPSSVPLASPAPISAKPSALEPAATPATPPPRQDATPQPLLNVPLRLVGVIGKLYVVFESDRGLVLLDQHAAHERILFEQMLDRMEQQGSAPSQRLLLPETIELSAKDSHFIRELLPTLTRLGVSLNEFGERTFLLDALPPFVKVKDSRRFVLELIDELKAAGHEVNSMRLGEHTVAKTVCRHAVKANDPLNDPELENLVSDLRYCTMPYTCPHGRPTLIEMSYRELEKKFGRQQ